ncbi:HAD hydrolase-like protein [Paenibacillus lentus]|uniref:HAD hydrolase-like protein n=1 Tax=Paenibacillus lentus TaxID=1338368 RepID=UPI0036560F16
MPKYDHVIFDVDGTLIDTEKAVMYSLQKMLKIDYNREVQLSDLNFVLGIARDFCIASTWNHRYRPS